MASNPDFKELLQELSDADVNFLVVGAHAVMFYSVPRYTKNLDIWVQANSDNAVRVYQALQKFGVPLSDLSIQDLTSTETVFQIGIEPNRIDILTGLEGLTFEQAWKNKTTSTYDGVPINLIGMDDLIINKTAVGRPQDMLDLNHLEKAKTKK